MEPAQSVFPFRRVQQGLAEFSTMREAPVQALLVVGVVAAMAGLTYLIFLAREQRIGPRRLRALTVAAAVGLGIMLLSDWPFEVLDVFWADHSVLAGLLSTVLLVALGFLAFENSERERQDRLDSSLTAAGLSGLVDHVIDVELALALVSQPGPPTLAGWQSWDDLEGKPLRWLRNGRERLSREGEEAAHLDPRRTLTGIDPRGGRQGWRSNLLDQSVRRVSAGLRDWSPVVGVSRNGRHMLVAFASLRMDLVKLAGQLEHDRLAEVSQDLVVLRSRCRLMAYYFEKQSGSRPLRPEVLETMQPLPLVDGMGATELMGLSRAAISADWRVALEESFRRLRPDEPDSVRGARSPHWSKNDGKP